MDQLSVLTIRAHTIVEHCTKNQLIRLRTLEETFDVTHRQVKTANNRYCRSLMATSGSLKLGSARANSSTALIIYLVFQSRLSCVFTVVAAGFFGAWNLSSLAAAGGAADVTGANRQLDRSSDVVIPSSQHNTSLLNVLEATLFCGRQRKLSYER